MLSRPPLPQQAWFGQRPCHFSACSLWARHSLKSNEYQRESSAFLKRPSCEGPRANRERLQCGAQALFEVKGAPQRAGRRTSGSSRPKSSSASSRPPLGVCLSCCLGEFRVGSLGPKPLLVVSWASRGTPSVACNSQGPHLSLETTSGGQV